MEVNEDGDCLDKRSALEFIASKLAPTIKGGNNVGGYQSNAQFFAAHCRAVFIEDV